MRWILYFLFNILMIPVYAVVMVFRIFRHKETYYSAFVKVYPAIVSILPLRISGLLEKPYSDGYETVWVHAASVGEVIIAKTLIDKIEKKHLKVKKNGVANEKKRRYVISTCTLTSKEVIKKVLVGSGLNVVHIFAPVDNYFAVLSFMQIWRPKICILMESELWPIMLHTVSKAIPICVVNARMSEKSFGMWDRNGYTLKFARNMLACIKYISTQSNGDLQKYQHLSGCIDRVGYDGNLKYLVEIPAVNHVCVPQFGDRVVILFASTHDDEERHFINAYADVAKSIPGVVFVIAPRHTDRGVKIANDCLSSGVTCMLRSDVISKVSNAKSHVLPNNVSVYIADTVGEMHMWYGMASVVVIGGSFNRHGHNPIEPALHDKSIIFGPNMSNFKEIAFEFLNANVAFQTDYVNLSSVIIKIFNKDINLNSSKKFIDEQKSNVNKSYDRLIEKLEGLCAKS